MSTQHHGPQTFADYIAYYLAKLCEGIATLLFRQRFGHRVVVLETLAAIPGMVSAMLMHFSSLRRIKNDKPWLQQLLAEAENERMHLMIYSEITRPTKFEWAVIYFSQPFFIIAYFLLYVISAKTAHRYVAYLEEDAISGFEKYKLAVVAGKIPNTPAPLLAIAYWKLSPDACLLQVIEATMEDEKKHRDINHCVADGK